MGFFNNETPEEKAARKEAKALLKERISFQLPVKFIAGEHLVNAPKSFLGNTMYQLDDNTVIFNLDDPVFFNLSTVEFAGAKYHEEVSNQGQEDTKSKSKTKKHSHGLGGALLGTALLPGVGTIAGAIAGSHNGKSKTEGESSTTSSSTSTARQVEDPSSTTLTLVKASDGEEVQIIVETKTADYQKLTTFKTIDKPTSDNAAPVEENTNNSAAPVSSSSDDAIEQIRKFKGLLDDGIISQDEFDAKKKELLGL